MEKQISRVVSHHLTKDDTNFLRSIVEGDQMKEDLAGQGYWHRFTIIGGAPLNREEILKLIIAQVHPAPLIPVSYQIDGDDAFFLVSKGCKDAIIMLCKNQLTISHPRIMKQINLEIILNYMEENEEDIKVGSRIVAVNASRFITGGTLDLTFYHKDSGFGDEIFIPLFVPATLLYVFSFSPDLLLLTRTFILSGNDIHSLEGIDFTLHKQAKELDLRHNQLDWEGFSKISNPKITKIWLDDNPLCNDFINQKEYIAAVRSVLPSITHLDGVLLSDLLEDVNNIISMTYFAPNIIAKSLAEQFVRHFFVLSESRDTVALTRLYGEKALFSLTFNTTSNPTSKVLPIKSLDRNILKVTDYNKLYTGLKRGPEEIMVALSTFPQFKFDKDSVQIDVPFYQNGHSILIVTSGLLHTEEEYTIPSYFTFQRSFIVEKLRVDLEEWKISNDIFTLSSTNPPNVIQILNSVRGGEEVDWSLKPKSATKEGRRELEIEIKELTSMDSLWCKKFLDDAGWDLETALQAFTDQYKIHQIPTEAFFN